MPTRGRPPRRSDGSPPLSPSPQRALGSALIRLRQSRGLTQGDLADRLDISRSYYSLLETTGDKEPSLEFLRKLSTLLVGPDLDTPDRLRDAARLGLGALGFEFRDPYAKLIGTPPEEISIQADPTVKAVWILSEILGEVSDQLALDQTVLNLMRPDPVRYVYFVPHGRNQWNTCKELIETATARKGLTDLADGRLRAIACPQLTCVPPISIVHLTTTRKATVTLGNPTADPIFYALDDTQIHAIITELDQVLTRLHSQLSWRSEYATYTRLYPST